jgi:HAD superfamily hydrolase (TIGR01509 family)
MTLEGVVFDFDGLIMDSEWTIYESARAAFVANGHELPVAAWATIVGTNDDTDDTWWPRLRAAAGTPGFDRSDFDAVYEATEGREALRATMLTLPALPGVEVLVDALTATGHPIGVASSSSTGWLERNLERLGLIDRFATLVGADAVGGVGKPSPDVYLKACADLGVDPRGSVALEDSAHGVTAAKAAGMAAVAVPSRITRFNDFAHADRVVESLEHVTVADLDLLVPSPHR